MNAVTEKILDEFMAIFYGEYPETISGGIRSRLRSVLTAEGARVSGAVVRGATEAALGRAMLAVIENPPNNRDQAALVVLRKLEYGPVNIPVTPSGVPVTEAASAAYRRDTGIAPIIRDVLKAVPQMPSLDDVLKAREREASAALAWADGQPQVRLRILAEVTERFHGWPLTAIGTLRAMEREMVGLAVEAYRDHCHTLEPQAPPENGSGSDSP